MSIRIFISHSVAPRELALVDAMAEEVARRGAVPFIPRRDWKPDNVVPEDIKKEIKKANYIIAIASQEGHHSQWVNTEVVYGQNLTPRKPLLLVADAKVPINSSCKKIVINRSNPLSTISEVSQRIQRLIQDKKTQDLLTGFLVGGLILLFLYSLKKD
ncbi:MAG: toll/interleukin-1 receptor domain-containing protein [bacterium]|nr:toll/interleukin-1 receptor domain-containing protein [bacterium]